MEICQELHSKDIDNIAFFTIFGLLDTLGKMIVKGGAANKSNGENGYDLHTLGVDKMVSTE